MKENEEGRTSGLRRSFDDDHMRTDREGFIGECAQVHYSMMGYVPEVKPILQTVQRDITYQLQAPRAVALRFPLGNPFGSSMDASMQTRILRDALAVLDSAKTPGEIVDLPYDWEKGLTKPYLQKPDVRKSCRATISSRRSPCGEPVTAF
jgi:hypothetical protein